MPFKRKFAFHLAPIKTTLGLDKSDKPEKSAISDKSKHHSGLLSPLFSPPSPTIERPVISAQQEAELRNCIIRVLRDINRPSDRVYEEMFWKKKSSKPTADEKPSDVKDKTPARPTHKENPSFTVAGPQDGGSSETGAKRYDSGIGVEPNTGGSSTTRNQSQRQSKAGLSAGPAASTDGSTVTTDATRDVDASAASTGLTSAVLTPGDAGKTNTFAQGFSKSEPASAPPETSDAQNWMAQEFAIRQSDKVAAPAPASSTQPPSSAIVLIPTTDSALPRNNDSKRRNTVAAQTNTAAATAALTVPRQDQKTEVATSKKVPWWKRSSVGRRKSSPSLRPTKSEGDTPVSKSGGRTPNPDIVVPPLPRLDSAKWSEKPLKKEDKNDTTTNAKDLVSIPKKSPPPTPPKKPFSTVQAEEPDEIKRPGSAIIIDEDGHERALSFKEERKRDSDIQSAVKAKMLAGSVSSRPSTPALSTTDRDTLELSRPNSQQSAKSARSAQSSASLKAALPAPVAVESSSPDKTEASPTPRAAERPALPPRVDSRISSPPRVGSQPSSSPPTVSSKPSPPLDTNATTSSPPRVDSKFSSPVDTKPTTSSLPKLSTVTQINVPKTEVHSATPITPAQELEDPYAPKTLEHARTASPPQTKPTRGSSFLKRFSSLRDSKPKNDPVSITKVSSKELKNQREAKMKAYGKILETHYEGPDSKSAEARPSAMKPKMLDANTSKVRSSSPTPSDLYAL